MHRRGFLATLLALVGSGFAVKHITASEPEWYPSEPLSRGRGFSTITTTQNTSGRVYLLTPDGPYVSDAGVWRKL